MRRQLVSAYTWISAIACTTRVASNASVSRECCSSQLSASGFHVTWPGRRRFPPQVFERLCRVVKRHEHVPEVRAHDGGTHGGKKIRVEAVAPPDTSSQLSALKHLRRVGVLFRRTVSWRGVLAVIPGKPRVPHCEERPGARTLQQRPGVEVLSGSGGCWRGACFVLYLDNQVNKRWTIDGVNSTHCVGDVVHFISYWRIVLHSPKFNCSR